MKEQIDAVRNFNRFYTRQIGLLNQTLLQSEFSLTQARILFELANRSDSTASNISDITGIDPGYVSRTLAAFEQQGLLRRTRSNKDSRERILKLTAKGKRAFLLLNQRSSQQAQALLENLSQENRERLLHCMKTIKAVLQPLPDESAAVTLRLHRPGDIGWITHRHGLLYAEEYGWDTTFEALVAEILVRFIQKNDRDRERLWLAELHGERAGSVMIVDAGENVAQLRLLLVEPWARGRKIGKRLVDECTGFAREKGYQKIKLWTQSNLLEARKLYVKSGYELVEEKPHTSFGHNLTSEIWELRL